MAAMPARIAARQRIAQLRGGMGDRLRYVFRHWPIPRNELGKRATVLAKVAGGKGSSGSSI